MASRTIVITGANSGIGFETASHLAGKGDNVIMACRSLDKAEKARGEILGRHPEASVTVLKLDVSDLGSVTEFSKQFGDEVGSLDVLVNNAGIAAVPLTRNSAGHEMQLATNYLGAFALTGLLLPLFVKTPGARIVNVGSLAHRLGKLNLDDLNWEHTEFDEWKGYANSKVATMSQTLELNRRLQQQGSNIIALGAHPGFANTNIQSNSPTLQKRQKKDTWLSRKIQGIVPTADRAAQPVIHAVDHGDVSGGDYYGPGGLLETGIGGKVKPAKIKAVAKDPALAKKLWSLSETMTGVFYLSQN